MLFELTSKGILLNAVVASNAKKFEIKIDEQGNCLKIRAKQKAMNGKANEEIEKNLGKIFKAKATIVSGLHSKRKKILLNSNDTEKFKLIQKSLL